MKGFDGSRAYWTWVHCMDSAWEWTNPERVETWGPREEKDRNVSWADGPGRTGMERAGAAWILHLGPSLELPPLIVRASKVAPCLWASVTRESEYGHCTLCGRESHPPSLTSSLPHLPFLSAPSSAKRPLPGGHLMARCLAPQPLSSSPSAPRQGVHRWPHPFLG